MLWVRRAASGCLLLSELCAAGCQSRVEREPTGARAAPPARTSAAAEAAARLCTTLLQLPAQRKAACCGGEPVAPLFAECTRTVQASLASGASELDEAALAGCTRAIESSLAGCDWVTPGQAPLPAACRQLLVGHLAEGAVCHSTLECAGQLHCDGATPAKAGRCAPPAALGEACGVALDTVASFTLMSELERSHPPCQDFCSLVTHHCEPVPPLGAACSASVNCANGQSCVDGRCAARSRQAGEACLNAACGAGMRCAGGVCRTKAAPGEHCDTDFDCQQGGCVDARCGMQCASPLSALHAIGGGLRAPAVIAATRLPTGRTAIEPGANRHKSR